MMAQTVATKTARPYQEQLFLYAKDRDCIINLQTGAGKTFIAIMLMKQFADELDGELGKRIFFLVPTKPLVAQQAAEIRGETALKVAEFSGSSYNYKPEEHNNADTTASDSAQQDSKKKEDPIHIDQWDFKIWIKMLKDVQVAVMTRQIFLNAVSHGCIPLDRVHSIIFDEAHHAGPTKKGKNTKDAYKLIMDIVSDPQKVSVKSRPRIWGLTGSLIKSRIEDPEKVCQLVGKLEDIFKARCISADLDLLGKHGTNPNEELWLYPKDNLPSVCSTVTDLLTSMTDFLIKIQKDLQYVSSLTSEFSTNNDDDDFVPSVKSHSSGMPISLGDFQRNIVNIKEILQQMGPWCALSALKEHIAHLDKTLKLFEGMDSNYDAILNTFVKFFSCCCDLLSAFLNRQTEYDRMFTFVSTKMLVLLEILKKYKCIGTPEDFECNLAGIIFIEKRAECKALCEFLQIVRKYQQYSHIKVDYIVGSAAQPGFKTILAARNAAMQKKVLKAFKNKETNLLVATSVLEEGLDVPHCNLVVRYDAPKTYRQWKQSKGRARAEDSRYIMMCEIDGKNVLKRDIDCFRQTENMLEKINKGVNEFIEDEDEQKENFVPNPFVDEDEAELRSPTGAKITLDTSASIVQMYCNRLPHDSFTKPSPFESFKRKKSKYGQSNDSFRCKIQMPLNCAIPEPEIGPWKSTTDKARKCTYLRICKKLYELGELDEYLIPKKKQETVKRFLQELDLDFDEYLKREKPTPGTRGRKGKYPRFTDILLSNSIPLVSECECVLFLVEMTPNGYECHPSANEKKLGFLTSQVKESQRVDLCSFPIYSKEGKIDIVFKMAQKLTLTPGQLKALRQFYENTYVKALRGVYEDNNQLDPDYLPSYYFLPLTRQNTIDWVCIEETNQSFLNTDRIEAYDLLQSKHSLDEYIVYTTYKKLTETGEEQPGPDIRFYLVKKTASEKMPTSKFPKRKKSSSKDFDTFIDYYKEEYNLIVKDQTRPLFEAIPAGFSFYKVNSLREKPYAAKNAIVHLVPEYCGVLPFPASYWFKLMAVPAIVFRLNSLLSSRSLKEEVERLAFHNELQTNEAWQEFDLSPADCAKYGIVSKDEPHEEENEVLADMAEEDDDSEDDAEEATEVSSSEDEQHVSDFESSLDESPSSPLVNNQVVLKNKTLTIVEPKLPNRSFPDSGEVYLKDEHFISKYPNFQPESFIQRITVYLSQAIISLLMSRKELSVQHENIAPVDDDVRPDLSTVIDRRVDSFDSHAFGVTNEGPSTLLILQALTAKHAQDFFNFERLEVIGDSFLKFSTCCYLFLKYPSMSLDHMVDIKDHNVRNYNLYRLAVKKGIQKCIIYEKFDAKTYYVPPGFNAKENQLHQEISDKSVADSTEALIGAYLIALGPVGAIKFMSWLGIKVADGEVSLSDKHWLPEPPPAIPPSITNRVEAENLVEKLYRRFLLEKFEERIGYEFKNKGYLVQAFTHNSYYLNTATPCYQRLELLGDAVLDYLVTRHIYEDKVKKFSPGELTNLRQALVSNAFFACMAVKYGYHKHIMSISYDATTAIKTFVSRYNEQDRKLILGSFITDLEDDWDVGESDIPKVLGDVFESVAGAIYLDSGLSLDAVFTVYYRLIQHELKTFSEKIPVAPVRKLFELQGKIDFSKATKLASGEVETTVTLSKPARGLKSFTGVGKTIRTARIAAAKKALKVILKPA